MEITGRLTADAKVTTLKDERQVVNFTIALNDYYKPKGSSEAKKIATYIHCSYWVNCKIAQHLTKGALVELYGRIGVNTYTSMEGAARASLTFHVNNVKIHYKPKSEFATVQDTAVQATSTTVIDEDLPF